MTATDTYLLLRALCDELARCGLRIACTSPGSRCTPIVLSLVREPRLSCFSHLDERCAGFFALGAAKASGLPVALTCTSGTAAANLAPAVIEAFHARVPMIVLTADRPPELREVGAGQTIDQLKLFGGAVKWFFEAGVHEATPEGLRFMRTLACRAFWTALEGRPGPVHLNLPLREPLVLDQPLPEDDSGRPDGRPWVSRPPRQAAPDTDAIVLPARGVIVAGRDERSPGFGRAVARFAERAGYPLLADPLSGARHGPAVVARYDMLLRDPALAADLRPELILRVGDLPTSKPLRTWLAGLAEVRQVAIDPEGAWQDPAGVLSQSLAGDPAAILDAASSPTTAAPVAIEWLARWRELDDALSVAIEDALGDQLSEPAVAAALSTWLPPSATLFIASSMPIRDIELFAGAGEAAPRMLSNRGANGIDGTVSSAFGAAAGGEGPVVLLIGDLALAYDIGGLLAARRTGLAVTIVLLNNDGGGIFHFLPVSGERDAFEDHVATPTGLDFAHAAALYGCGYETPATLGELRAAVEHSLGGGRTTIIEVNSDRGANLELHRRIAVRALAALPGARD